MLQTYVDLKGWDPGPVCLRLYAYGGKLVFSYLTKLWIHLCGLNSLPSDLAKLHSKHVTTRAGVIRGLGAAAVNKILLQLFCPITLTGATPAECFINHFI